jgi:hypothetical protein
MSTERTKGKAVDRSSPGHGSVGNDGGHWVSGRYGSSGELEHDFEYRYPETSTPSHWSPDEVSRAQEENEETILSSEAQRSVGGGGRRFTNPRPVTEVEMGKAKGFSGIENLENQKETMYE